MAFDVMPGTYTFTWNIGNVKPGKGEKMLPGVFELRGGRITYLSADNVM